MKIGDKFYFSGKQPEVDREQCEAYGFKWPLPNAPYTIGEINPDGGSVKLVEIEVPKHVWFNVSHLVHPMNHKADYQRLIELLGNHLAVDSRAEYDRNFTTKADF